MNNKNLKMILSILQNSSFLLCLRSIEKGGQTPIFLNDVRREYYRLKTENNIQLWNNLINNR